MPEGKGYKRAKVSVKKSAAPKRSKPIAKTRVTIKKRK